MAATHETPYVASGQPVGVDGVLERLARLDESLRRIATEYEANQREYEALRQRQDVVLAEQRELLSKLNALER